MSHKLVINRCYHVKGWKSGTFFRLVDIENDVAVLQRPKYSPNNGKKWRVPVSSLFNINRNGAKRTLAAPKSNVGEK